MVPRQLAITVLLLALVVVSGCTTAEGICDRRFLDEDGDGWGAGEGIVSCESIPGYVDQSGDCDDSQPEIAPALTDRCDGVDTDCDGTIDEDGGDVWYVDGDHDGYGAATSEVDSCEPPPGSSDVAGDCNDRNAEINPDAIEACNQRDDNCDGQVDEELKGGPWYADEDRDGYGGGEPSYACEQPEGWITEGGDCDDSLTQTNPGAAEGCDGLDQDCDDQIDEEASLTFCRDVDQDGFGDPANTEAACVASAGYVLLCTDCDDADADVNPSAEEVCDQVDNDCDPGTHSSDSDVDGDGQQSTACGGADCDDNNPDIGQGKGESCDNIDNNCNGVIDDIDVDGDGYLAASCGGSDCRDNDITSYPQAEERCDNIDNDCNGQIDDNVGTTWYPDGDQDGYGFAGGEVTTCSPPTGFISDGSDCDDTLAEVNPGVDEICNEIDDNCDEVIDDVDKDGDGFLSSECDGEDCDDERGDVNPAALEICDEGIDNNCDGESDNVDQDEDGWVPPACGGYDCNDMDPKIHPYVPEECDGLDEDCDREVDEGATTLWYVDSDGDGFGRTTDMLGSCDSLPGYSEARGDCNDENPNVHPGAEDRDDDDQDADCGGTGASDPHVRLTLDDFQDIRDALETAKDGQILWVGEGVYVEPNLSFDGKKIIMTSTHGPARTIIRAPEGAVGKRTILYFNKGEDKESVLDGFTITGGYHDFGAGISISEASPTIRWCYFTDNSALQRGGGIDLYKSTSLIEGCWFYANYSLLQGGGVAITSGAPVLHNNRFEYNEANQGGGLFIQGDTDFVLEHADIERNYAWGATGGGGIFLQNNNNKGVLRHLSFFQNSVDAAGGGLYLYQSSPTLEQCVFGNNYAGGGGGGIYLLASTAGGTSSPVIRNTVIAYNAYYNILSVNYPRLNIYNTPVLSGDVIYGYDGTADNVNVTEGGFTVVEPGFSYLPVEWELTHPDYHLDPISPLVNSGDSLGNIRDPDGSRPDIGVYGGPRADERDLDQDGYPDWFWPGTLEGAPPNTFEPSAYDCRDQDPGVRVCPP